MYYNNPDYTFSVHQSGELETLLENNEVIPKIEEPAAAATQS